MVPTSEMPSLGKGWARNLLQECLCKVTQTGHLQPYTSAVHILKKNPKLKDTSHCVITDCNLN